MRELTYLGPRRVEWRSVPEPRLGWFDPLAVTTVIADWEDAPAAFTTPATKVIVQRSSTGT